DSATGIATYKGHIELPAYSVVIDFDQVITMDASTGKGTMALFTNCTDPIPNGTSCQGFKSALAGPMKNTLGGDLQIGNPDGMDPTPTQSKTAVAFTPTDGGQYIWTLQVYNAGTDSNGDPTLVYSPTPLVVGMAKQLSSITADTFTSTYNATYELTPELTKIAGSYSVGATGIETAMHTTTYILTIASDGSVSGLEPDTQCAYAGSLAPHDAGNLYDISVTFSGTGCPYAGQSFAGVARIDGSDSAVDPVVITATNAARTNGFMVVGKQ
ncbi:MAG TPA: hypothetical protein VFM32_05115, partial [Spongiibacteraceae bacterium]|nr:hypothetical protein [Spongiibacteraceae bacterium]